MIKFVARDAKGEITGFGLSEENIALLKEKKPIVIDNLEFGKPGRTLIFYAETEAEMLADLRKAGFKIQ